MKRFLFSIFFFISVSVLSQTPGYMGKKVSFGLTSLCHPNAFSLIISSNLKYSRPIITNGLHLNIVTGKRSEIEFGMRYSNRKIDIPSAPNGNDINTPSFERFSLFEYGFAFKKFTNTKFAPLGLYSKYEVFYLSGQLNFQAYQVYSYDPIISNYTFIEKEGGVMNFKGGGVAYALGKQRVFKDLFVLDFGFRNSLMFLRSDNSGNQYENSLERSVLDPISFLPITQFYIGIGLLAF